MFRLAWKSIFGKGGVVSPFLNCSSKRRSARRAEEGRSAARRAASNSRACHQQQTTVHIITTLSRPQPRAERAKSRYIPDVLTSNSSGSPRIVVLIARAQTDRVLAADWPDLRARSASKAGGLPCGRRNTKAAPRRRKNINPLISSTTTTLYHPRLVIHSAPSPPMHTDALVLILTAVLDPPSCWLPSRPSLVACVPQTTLSGTGG